VHSLKLVLTSLVLVWSNFSYNWISSESQWTLLHQNWLSFSGPVPLSLSALFGLGVAAHKIKFYTLHPITFQPGHTPNPVHRKVIQPHQLVFLIFLFSKCLNFFLGDKDLNITNCNVFFHKSRPLISFLNLIIFCASNSLLSQSRNRFKQVLFSVGHHFKTWLNCKTIQFLLLFKITYFKKNSRFSWIISISIQNI
jgi:hypothetical protein